MSTVATHSAILEASPTDLRIAMDSCSKSLRHIEEALRRRYPLDMDTECADIGQISTLKSRNGRSWKRFFQALIQEVSDHCPEPLTAPEHSGSMLRSMSRQAQAVIRETSTSMTEESNGHQKSPVPATARKRRSSSEAQILNPTRSRKRQRRSRSRHYIPTSPILGTSSPVLSDTIPPATSPILGANSPTMTISTPAVTSPALDTHMASNGISPIAATLSDNSTTAPIESPITENRNTGLKLGNNNAVVLPLSLPKKMSVSRSAKIVQGAPVDDTARVQGHAPKSYERTPLLSNKPTVSPSTSSKKGNAEGVDKRTSRLAKHTDAKSVKKSKKLDYITVDVSQDFSKDALVKGRENFEQGLRERELPPDKRNPKAPTNFTDNDIKQITKFLFDHLLTTATRKRWHMLLSQLAPALRPETANLQLNVVQNGDTTGDVSGDEGDKSPSIVDSPIVGFKASLFAHSSTQPESLRDVYRHLHIVLKEESAKVRPTPEQLVLRDYEKTTNLLQLYRAFDRLRTLTQNQDPHVVALLNKYRSCDKTSLRGKDYTTTLREYMASQLSTTKKHLQDRCMYGHGLHIATERFGDGILALLPGQAAGKFAKWGPRRVATICDELDRNFPFLRDFGRKAELQVQRTIDSDRTSDQLAVQHYDGQKFLTDMFHIYEDDERHDTTDDTSSEAPQEKALTCTEPTVSRAQIEENEDSGTKEIPDTVEKSITPLPRQGTNSNGRAMEGSSASRDATTGDSLHGSDTSNILGVDRQAAAPPLVLSQSNLSMQDSRSSTRAEPEHHDPEQP